MKTTRLHNLDYLRGLAAFSIMIFHYAGFIYKMKFSPDDFMQKIGIYGVSIFYVLSGLTLFHVYSGSMKPDREGLVNFFLKRGVRIMPLLWVVSFSYILLWGWPGLKVLFVNLTGLTSLLALIGPGYFYGTGLWSIGNELIFYLFFPLFMFLLHKQTWLLALLSVLLFVIYCFFAFYLMTRYENVFDAWNTYVNPLNQVFLFLSGFLAGIFLKDYKASNSIMLLLLMLSVTIFVFYPVQGRDAIALMTGGTRMLYTALSVLICVTAYKITYQLPALIDKPLRILGEISYSLYLLHPVVWFTLKFGSKNYYTLPVPVISVVSVVGTLVLSYLSYIYFEKYFIQVGRKVSQKLTYRREMAAVK